MIWRNEWREIGYLCINHLLHLWFVRIVFKLLWNCFVLMLLHTYLLIVIKNCDFTRFIDVVPDLKWGTLMQSEMYIDEIAWKS